MPLQSHAAATVKLPEADDCDTNNTLRALFSRICKGTICDSSRSGFDSPGAAWLRDSEARCIGAYAAWFSDLQDWERTWSALEYLLRCMAQVLLSSVTLEIPRRR